MASLRIVYSCIFGLYLAVINVVQVSTQDTQGEQTMWICDGEQGTIECSSQQRINIISAAYGIEGNKSDCRTGCTTIPLVSNCDCSSDVTAVVQDICDGKYICEVNSHDSEFGDPCKFSWIKEFLRLTYSCDNVAMTPVLTTTESTDHLSTTVTTTTVTAVITDVTFTTAKPATMTGSIIQPQTTVDTQPETTVKTTEGFTHEDISTSGPTLDVTTTLRGNSDALNSHGSPGGTVIMAIVGACVVAFILIPGVAGFIFWKRRKRPDSTESPTSIHNNIYDEVTTSTNIQLTNTGATYRTDGNCNPTDPANIADLYAKPNKKKSAPNDQLYAKPIKKKINDLNVDQMYAKPHKATGGSNSPCNSGLNNEEEGYVDNMLYESTGTITFTTIGNEEGYVDNELYGSTA